MTVDQGAGILYVAMAMVLVVSALVARRLPLSRAIKLALVWIVIFAVVILIFAALGGS